MLICLIEARQNADGNEVASAVRPADSTKVMAAIPDSHRWNIDDLYTVTAALRHRNEAYDEVSIQVGMGHFVDSEELLGGVFFLCDDKAPSALIGVVFLIEAGFHTYSGV